MNQPRISRCLAVLIVTALFSTTTYSSNVECVLQAGLLHLRSGDAQEWDVFPRACQATSLDRLFDARVNDEPWTLSLRQLDVKQSWDIRINDKMIGRLVRDENDLVSDFLIPANTLNDGENRLQIIAKGGDSDDIRLGNVRLLSVSPSSLRSESTVIIDLVDEQNLPLPGRITVVNAAGTLVPVHTEPTDQLAVRQGVIYSANGTAEFGVQPGDYRVYASRGFEYNAPSVNFHVGSGERLKRTLTLKREVDTQGWVACDTHVHTVTHSGHGDATIQERMATLAGEAIEFPIATDHNKHIDYRPISTAVGVKDYFTSVIGNEVTTKQGHFNVFPVSRTAATPDHTTTDWPTLFQDIYATPDVKVAILNHARDIHGGFRPFSPRHHISLSGENLDERVLNANAMEIINSGAVQTDVEELFRDWCGLINRGKQITPVGSSDSHDVSRYIVGQGRTYIRCADDNPGGIDVNAATEAFLRGNVIVSYGLMADMKVNGTVGPGDLLLATKSDQQQIEISITVRAPSWVTCDEVDIYVNGQKRFSEPVKPQRSKTGIVAEVVRRLPMNELRNDVWLTAVARGPGVVEPFWPMAKPYQPDSPTFIAAAFSSTGPIFIDVDGDKAFTSPYDQARKILDNNQDNLRAIQTAMANHDGAVAIQVASLLTAAGVDLASPSFSEKLKAAPDEIRAAVLAYRKAWRESQVARAERTE